MITLYVFGPNFGIYPLETSTLTCYTIHAS
jgi:hypothetical protein